jgi:dCTP deaminase
MRCVQPNKFTHTDTHEPGIGIDMEPIGGFFRLMPGELYLASSIEFFGSDDFVPTIHGRSSAARHGLMVHLAAGFADCGWRGNLVFELVNLTPYPMMVYPGDRIAQIAFERVEGEVDLYHSTYQGQLGIVGAKSLADE